MFTVVELAPEQTHPVRRAVLRDGTASDQVEFDGDELDTTIHLGVELDGAVVAVSSWMLRRYPDLPEHPAHQLRGMATAPDHRRRGLGTEMLNAGLARCALAGSTVVWARARETAIAFYVAHGFDVVGQPYVDLTTGLPHRDIVRRLSTA